RLVAKVGVPTPQHILEAGAAADDARAPLATLSAEERAGSLRHAAERLGDRAERIAKLITDQQGLPIRLARMSVTRASAILRWAADETMTWHGLPATADSSTVLPSPRGPVIAVGGHVTPFNLQAG